MPRQLLYSIFFLVLFSCNSSQQPLTEAEVTNVINRFDEGWNTKNLKLVDSVLSPAYVYFTQSGNTFSRDSVVATAGESTYSLKDVSRTEIMINIYDNTAVVSTRWKGKGMYRGKPFNEDQRCSITVIKHGDKVEILSEHCTPIKSGQVFH